MTFKLPENVRPVPDRHGKIRYRFRKVGHKSAYIKGKPGTKEFYVSLAEALSRTTEPIAPVSPFKPEPKTLDDLYRLMKQTPKWKKKSATTQHRQALVYERFLNRVAQSGARYGARRVENVTVAWLNNIFGSMADTPGAANDLRKKLSVLMRVALTQKWLASNPVTETEKYDPGEGFHDWTDAEIEQYRAYHPLGTTARLVLEIALNTAGRRCNVARLPREAIKGGDIYTEHAKGNNSATVPLMASTQAAIDAMPTRPLHYVIVTQFGRPFTPAGLGNKMREWCDDAGLPQCSMHGLRKSISRQLAQKGASDAQGMAVTGHKKDKTFQHYRAAANRTALARDAMSNLGPLAVVQPAENDENAST